MPRRGRKSAVVAYVPAQVRQGNEELFGVGQKGAEAVIAQGARLGHHLGKIEPFE